MVTFKKELTRSMTYTRGGCACMHRCPVVHYGTYAGEASAGVCKSNTTPCASKDGWSSIGVTIFGLAWNQLVAANVKACRCSERESQKTQTNKAPRSALARDGTKRHQWLHPTHAACRLVGTRPCMHV